MRPLLLSQACDRGLLDGLNSLTRPLVAVEEVHAAPGFMGHAGGDQQGAAALYRHQENTRNAAETMIIAADATRAAVDTMEATKLATKLVDMAAVEAAGMDSNGSFGASSCGVRDMLPGGVAALAPLGAPSDFVLRTPLSIK